MKEAARQGIGLTRRHLFDRVGELSRKIKVAFKTENLELIGDPALLLNLISSREIFSPDAYGVAIIPQQKRPY